MSTENERREQMFRAMHEQSREEKATENQQQQEGHKPSTTTKVIIWFWLVAGMLLVGSCAAMMIVGSGSSDEPSSYSAEYACQEFVERRLKAPATAEFSNETASGFGYGEWTVTGAVDAQNSFGAKVRSTYTCVITTSEGSETWRLVSLSGL